MGEHKDLVHEMDNLHWKFEEIDKKLYVEMNLLVGVWKAAIVPVREFVSNKKVSVADLWSRHGNQIVMVRCSHSGSGSVLHRVNTDEFLYTDVWNVKLECKGPVFSVVFQGEDGFGALSGL